MLGALMTARRFAPLFWCQFLSAFNDNYVRQMLVMMLLFRFGGGDAGPKISLAVAIFVLPSIVFSALGGELADAHDKAEVARWLKFAEIFVQMIAAAGFVFFSLPLFYIALLGLGTIAALFSPIKYGILPDHLRREELVAGNALVEGATFAAIILGLVFGAYATAEGRTTLSVVVQLAVVALACFAASLFIPPTKVGAPGLRINPNIFASTSDILREIRRDDRQWTCAAAISWFWLTGAVALSLIPVMIKSRIGAGLDVETAINAFFAVGVAIGSLLAAFISHGRILLRPAPYLLVAMALLLLDMGFVVRALPEASHEVGVIEFFSGGAGLHIAIAILVFSAVAGLFVVPISAAVQAWAGADRRARVVGAVNVLNSIYMVAGSIATTLLLKLANLSEPEALIVLGVCTGLFAVYCYFRLPRSFDSVRPLQDTTSPADAADHS
jgi:acyl-[acyl-carrier-protein]-phospholipid O-acyltransferase/long-chain-fatty-acid--[acyl-carrier-protein] ligase